jgi:hypothetical protein
MHRSSKINSFHNISLNVVLAKEALTFSPSSVDSCPPPQTDSSPPLPDSCPPHRRMYLVRRWQRQGSLGPGWRRPRGEGDGRRRAGRCVATSGASAKRWWDWWHRRVGEGAGRRRAGRRLSGEAAGVEGKTVGGGRQPAGRRPSGGERWLVLSYSFFLRADQIS